MTQKSHVVWFIMLINVSTYVHDYSIVAALIVMRSNADIPLNVQDRVSATEG